MEHSFDQKFSEREIKEGKEFMKMKDFWLIFDDFDNCDLLQAILDKYYNDVPNMYCSEIQEYQNSSRVVVRCNVCNNTTLSSFDPFISHNNGKNHKKNMGERQDPSHHAMVDLPTVLEFKSIDEIENPFERGSLEFDLFESSHEIIGYQFLYREMKSSGELITCQLCARESSVIRRMKSATALKHMKSSWHQDNYLKAKFDVKNSILNDNRSRRKFISEVFRKEGKLMHKIFTIGATELQEESVSSRKRKHSESGSEFGGETSSITKDLVIKDPKVSETPEEFLQVLQGHLHHLNEINKGNDVIISKLQEDPEAIDLLISTANALSKKIYMFSLAYNSEFKEQAKKLLEKCEKLRLPSLGE